MESVLAQAIPIPVMESSSRYLLWITATDSRPSAPATRQMPCVRRRDSARAMGCSAKEKTKQTAEYMPKHNPGFTAVHFYVAHPRQSPSSSLGARNGMLGSRIPPMHYFDLAIIIVYLVAITAFGARFRSGQKNLKDYFLGGRTAPWWAISLSIVSAETSTLTIVGTPALAFGGNLGFLQIVLGYLLARIVISVLFLPQYFRGEMFTAYELMRRRFGERVRKLTASIFLVTRALAEGVRVFAISLVISIVLGTGEIASIVLIVLLTLFYTFEGGMTAVIWTDVVQMSLYVLGAIASFVIILGKIPGGWEHVTLVAGAAHKFTIFDFRFAPDMEFFSRTYSFWAGVAGGCFLTTATHGTDQLMVQRLLSARDERQSRAALM